MNADFEEVAGALQSALQGDSDPEAVAQRLSDLEPSDREKALAVLIREAASAVPLLERLSLAGEPASTQAVYALGTISDPAAASSLQRVSDNATSSEVRKAARRALHRLTSHGIRPEAAETTPSAAASTQRDDVYKVLASPIDGAGNRGIWFAFRKGGDVDFVSVLVGDEKGVQDAFARESSVARFDREANKALHDAEFPWIEMPADYARHVLDVAHRQNAVSGTSLPLEFLSWRERIAIPRMAIEQPIIYTVLGAGEVRWEPRYLDNSGNLYELDLFRGWILERDELAEFVRERLTAERSGLVLAGTSGEARDQLIEDRAIQTLFDARRRNLLKGRLEEMAYVLWRLGRLEAARSALAAGLALLPADRPLVGHPFVRQMIHWSLEIVAEMARSERTRAIRPGLQLHLP